MKRALTETKLKNAKPGPKAYKLADGGGLYVLVSPSGGKAWRFNYKFNGAYKTLAIGLYPDKSIAEARAEHDKAIDLLGEVQGLVAAGSGLKAAAAQVAAAHGVGRRELDEAMLAARAYS